MLFDPKWVLENKVDPFMSAAALSITEPERQALIAVMQKFERGEVAQSSNPYYSNQANGFHMSSVRHDTDCGTVACIMGWCQIIGGEALFDRGIPRNGCKLFHGLFMFGDGRRFHVNDPTKAAAAIRNYLTDGDAHWDLVLE